MYGANIHRKEFVRLPLRMVGVCRAAAGVVIERWRVSAGIRCASEGGVGARQHYVLRLCQRLLQQSFRVEMAYAAEEACCRRCACASVILRVIRQCAVGW